MQSEQEEVAVLAQQDEKMQALATEMTDAAATGFPARMKLWQLFFAHRDYFWRLGLCIPGGDPWDWGRDKYEFGDESAKAQSDEL